MLEVMQWLSIASLFCGCVLNIIACVGFWFFPDVHSRMHATGMTDTLGTALILLGLAFQTGWDSALGKLFLILLFSLLTNPTVSYVIANSALQEAKTNNRANQGRRAEP